ncbi:MAG TPA: glycosyltransferase family 4 protein, partial [Pyrinomonadaceae bacterium]|nr:glycosyltransferase family 4 protein [Pyrinomonadaceae bacterium]
MRVLAIVPSIYDTAPGQRFRIEQWEPLLRERGMEIVYAPFESEQLHSVVHQGGRVTWKVGLVADAFARRFTMLNSLGQYDVCYLFREAALLGPPLLERLLARKIPIVFDFDDAIFVSYRSPSNGFLSYLKFAGKAKTICRISSHVMVGNPYLAEYAKQYNQNVTVVPTTIDTEKYVGESRSNSSPVPVIGWTGSFSTVQHLDTLRGALQKLAQTERFRLRVIGTPRYELKGVEVEAMPWRSETEIEDLRPIDIGIMPLPDDLWSKGKCGLKALQFMALGIPVICSPVGVNTVIIQDGQNGFVPATEAEWIERLLELLRSSELRNRIGQAGRATVEQTYSAKAQAPRVYEIFRDLVSQANQLAAAKTSPRAFDLQSQ